RWNVIARRSGVAWHIVVLFAYVSIASLLNVSLVFAAFLAGIAAKRKESVEPLSSVSFAVFIPIYFALVGYKLDLAKTFSLTMLAVFLLSAGALKLASVWIAAKCAGFGSLDRINLAIATNARGGPGIVLASVAFDAGIINATFYTTLILIAIITSQLAGFWLEIVLRKGWPLLEETEESIPAVAEPRMVA
ncbi:MAG: cation:proton antiporter, partial [Acidobacteriales bacterium]|nr:cation:proton antiporter [Terriglobales bacterium]